MRGHESSSFHQRVDDYEEEDYDHDEYEEEVSDAEEEEEPEARKPTQEEQNFLKLREKLKDKFRQKLKKQGAGSFGHLSSSKDKKRMSGTTNDKFGSFFGPSQPVIAPRVIEESRSIRETKHIVSKASTSSSKRDPSTSEIRTYSHHQKPKVVNEAKKKAQTLKDMRDYSFLLSDDADLPSPAKEQPAPRNAAVPKSDGRSVHSPLKNKMPTKKPSGLVPEGHGLKNLSSTSRHMPTKVGPVKEAPVNRHKPVPRDPRKVLNGGVRNGLSQTAGSKVLTQKIPVHATSTNRVPGKVTVDPSLKQTSMSTKPHASTQSHYSEQRRVPQEPAKAKSTLKQPLPSSKVQPSKQISSHSKHDDRLKKRPAKRNIDEDEDGEFAIGMIRQMFRYDPSKYRGMDEDDSDMEVGFDRIQKEERRSSKIARKEDEEQLRLIEEEERRERMRKKQKLR
ncbi:uncharacterized protein [Typha latifolia]|uniref:uncharacterized protein n=1 Tax=Typha latifolia TaxID=4733 RepID=UPI003C2C3F7C